MGLLGADDDPDDEAISTLASAASGESVTRDRLAEEKAGIMLYNLKGAPIIDFIDDGEQPHFILRDLLDGIVIEDELGRKTVEMGADQCAFAVITDRRVLFLVGEEDGSVHRTSLAYEDAESLAVGDENEFTVCGPERCWTFSISSKMDDSEIDRALSFLEREIRGETSKTPTDADDGTGGVTDADEVGSPYEGDGSDASEDDPLIRAEPMTGPTVSVYPDRVVFDRESGIVASEKRREFPIESITGVEYKAAGRIGTGHVSFDRIGDNEADPFDSVTFVRKNNEEFKELSDAVQRLVRERYDEESGDGSDASESDAEKPDDDESAEPDEAVQLLREQFAKGEISEEEYESRLEVLQDTS